MENNTFIIKENDAGRRIDRIIRKMFPGIPLNSIYKAIRKGEIRLNKKRARPDTNTHLGDLLFISRFFTSTHDNEPRHESESTCKEEKDSLDPLILFENDHILALNKPAGLLVHGEVSLEKRVKACKEPEIPRSLSFRPGPAHRLDRNTSGLILFSKSLNGARIISEIFKENLCEKYYLGLFDGRIEKETEWRDRIYRDEKRKKTCPIRNPKAPAAITIIKPLIVVKEKTLALCHIHTGFTHQIRAQGMIHSHPLTGDKKYGSKIPSIYQGHYVLHSWGIRFFSFNRIIGRTSIFAPLHPGLYKILKSLCSPDIFKRTLSRTLKRLQQGVSPSPGGTNKK